MFKFKSEMLSAEQRRPIETQQSHGWEPRVRFQVSQQPYLKERNEPGEINLHYIFHLIQ